MTESGSKRVFFALWPTESMRQQWHTLFADSEVLPSVPPERRHLTLAYLGDVTAEQVSDARKVADMVSCEPFTFRLNRYGCFEKQRVVWVGCQEHCNLLQCLVDQLREGLQMRNLPSEVRPFTPHMTLLRKHRQVPGDWQQPDLEWSASEFVLVHSHRREQGLCYDLIGRWPLREKAA